jgi:hypothetical protein
MSKHHVGKVCIGPIKGLRFRQGAVRRRGERGEMATRSDVLMPTAPGWIGGIVTAAAVRLTRPRLIKGPENKKAPRSEAPLFVNI